MVERNLRRVHGPRLRPRRCDRAVRPDLRHLRPLLARVVPPPRHAARPIIDAGIERRRLRAHRRRALDAGNGVILALPHLGGWEWAGVWLRRVQAATRSPWSSSRSSRRSCSSGSSSCGERSASTSSPLGPRRRHRRARARSRPTTSCACCATATSAAAASRSSSSASARRCPAGPATLALRTGAPLLPDRRLLRRRPATTASCARRSTRSSAQGRLRDDVARVTQDLADELEGLIRAAPEQWHLIQPNWPSDHEELPKSWSEDPGRG